jgi:hypothetical protein
MKQRLTDVHRLPVHPAPRSSRRPAAQRSLRCVAEHAEVCVLVNGVSGPMGLACAKAALARGLHLLPVAFSGALACSCSPTGCAETSEPATRAGQSVSVAPGVDVQLSSYDAGALSELRRAYPVSLAAAHIGAASALASRTALLCRSTFRGSSLLRLSALACVSGLGRYRLHAPVLCSQQRRGTREPLCLAIL